MKKVSTMTNDAGVGISILLIRKSTAMTRLTLPHNFKASRVVADKAVSLYHCPHHPSQTEDYDKTAYSRYPKDDQHRNILPPYFRRIVSSRQFQRIGKSDLDQYA